MSKIKSKSIFSLLGKKFKSIPNDRRIKLWSYNLDMLILIIIFNNNYYVVCTFFQVNLVET